MELQDTSCISEKLHATSTTFSRKILDSTDTLILLEIKAPKKNGFYVTEYIKTDPRCNKRRVNRFKNDRKYLHDPKKFGIAHTAIQDEKSTTVLASKPDLRASEFPPEIKGNPTVAIGQDAPKGMRDEGIGAQKSGE